MSSLTDKKFDEKLDGLLVSSVCAGAEPEGFTIARMPEGPRFNRALFSSAATGIVLAGVLLFIWMLKQPLKGFAETPAAGEDFWMLLSDTIIAMSESLSSPVVLMYTAAIMAAVYMFAATRLIRFYRLH